jgi:hypothetical protein
MIAVNGTHVYFILQWIVPDSALVTLRGHLMRVPVAGGEPERIASLPTGSVNTTQALALTSTRAIFIQAPADGESNATIASVALGGGDVTVLATASGLANAVIVSERSAYFSDAGGVKGVALEGGSIRTLAPKVGALSLAILDETLYFSSEHGIYSVSTHGGDPVALAEASGGRSLIPCGSGICWFGGTALRGTLMQALPGSVPVALSTDLLQPRDVVFDGEAYFIASGHGLLSRVPAEGGSAAAIYTEALLTHVALEGKCLYWSSAATISSIALDTARTGAIE